MTMSCYHIVQCSLAGDIHRSKLGKWQLACYTFGTAIVCQTQGVLCPSGLHSELNVDSRPHTTAMVALENPHSSLPSLQHLGSATAAAGQKIEAALPHLSCSVSTRKKP